MADILSYDEVIDHINRCDSGSVSDHDEGEDHNSLPLPETTTFELKTVDLSTLNAEPAANRMAVLQYADWMDSEDPPPIVIGYNNEVLDGRHRVWAARRVGRLEIEAYVPCRVSESLVSRLLDK
jgi:hypothetical protein